MCPNPAFAMRLLFAACLVSASLLLALGRKHTVSEAHRQQLQHGGGPLLNWTNYPHESRFQFLAPVRRKDGRAFVSDLALTDVEKDYIVSQHNLIRSWVRVEATNMRKLAWDDTLATSATEEVAKCRYHTSERWNLTYGVNFHVYADKFTLTAMQLAEVTMARWFDERRQYYSESNSCWRGYKCHTYKQMVWATVERIGCSVGICEYLDIDEVYWQKAFFLRCHYSPMSETDRIGDSSVYGWYGCPYVKGKCKPSAQVICRPKPCPMCGARELRASVGLVVALAVLARCVS